MGVIMRLIELLFQVVYSDPSHLVDLPSLVSIDAHDWAFDNGDAISFSSILFSDAKM